MNTETTELAQYIRDTLFANYKQNRETLTNRWIKNRAAANADLEFDETGVWRKSERAEKWQSDTMVDVVRQKIVAAKATITDTAFKGSKVQFMLVAPEGNEPQEPAKIQPSRDQTIVQNERYITRQLENCDAVTELGKCVLSGATYGRYFAKRYTTQMRNDGFVQLSDNVYVEDQSNSSTMAYENKSCFSMFWDMESDDLTECEAVIESDYISPWELRQDKNKPFHFPQFIDKVIEESDNSNAPADDTTAIPEKLRNITKRTKTIHRLEVWGRVPRKKADSFEKMLGEEGLIEPAEEKNNEDENKDKGDMVEIFAKVADNHVVAYMRTDDPRERPYYMEDWEEVLDGNCGRGIADNLNGVMKTLNGSTRALEDNMKLTSKLILALKRAMIQEDVEKEMSSDKAIVTMTLDEESTQGINDAIQQLRIDPHFEELSALITTYLQFADMASSIPRAEQGQQSDNPQTAFELQQRLSRSGKYMGEIIKRLDKFTAKIINDFYRYNMLDPDLPIAKGVYKVKALGFSSYENQVIRLQKLMQFFALIIDRPDISQRVNTDWIVEEIAKAMDLDPDQVFKTEDQMQQESQAQQNSPQARAQALELQKLEGDVQMQELEAQKNQSEIEKNKMALEKDQHEMVLDDEKLKLERAKAVSDIKTKAGQTAKEKGKSQ